MREQFDLVFHQIDFCCELAEPILASRRFDLDRRLVDQVDSQSLRGGFQSIGDTGDGEGVFSADLSFEDLHIPLKGFNKAFDFLKSRFDVSVVSLDERIKLGERSSLFGHDGCYRQLITC